MKTCLYLTLLTTLCCTLAHAYPEDNYVFDRSGISYMTEGENTIFCIKGGSVVPMNAASFNNEVGIPEAARENVVKVQAVGGSGGAALRRDGRLAVWGSPFSDLEHGAEDVAYNPVSARHTRTVTNVVDIAALSTDGHDFPDSPTSLYMLMEDGTVRVFGENGEDLPIIPLQPDITDPVALYGNYSYVAVLDASGIARMIYNEGIHVITAVRIDRLHALRDIASISGACAIHTDGTVSNAYVKDQNQHVRLRFQK